jgi:hypothetical protein
VTDPQSRITALERGIRRWRRAALALASVLALAFLVFGWLVTQSQIRAERARQAEIEAREEAERRRDEARKAHYVAAIREASLEQARQQADAQHRFLEKGSGEKAK